ncbi:MAG: GNAT family N-acetyltransferase [Proteobacteria bacterium]|nr:GNAT family N-acetyltransferase [Pseudomonadota bacterium]
MTKIIGVITARILSNQFPPNMVMEDIAGKTSFAHHVERLSRVKGIDGIFLATSKNQENKPLIEEADKLGCGWYEGDEDDVVERHIALCEREGAEAVIRVTGNCPLFDIDSPTAFVKEFKRQYHDFIYVSNLSTIYGTLSELISYNALLEVHKHYEGAAVSLYIRKNMELFDTFGIEIDESLCRQEYRLILDKQPDLDIVRRIYNDLYKGSPLNLGEVYMWLDDNPEIAHINRDIKAHSINIQVANLMEKPVYSVISLGSRYIILDEQKRPIDQSELVKRLRAKITDKRIAHRGRKLDIRPANDGDAKDVFDWRNNPQVRKSSFNTNKIKWEQHEQWFNNKLQDPLVATYIFSSEEIKLGSIRFEEKDSGIWVSVMLNPGYVRKKLGAQLIKLATEKYIREKKPEKQIIAEVKANNIISNKTFLKAGYEESHIVYAFRQNEVV